MARRSYSRRRVIAVQAPRLIRSPSRSGIMSPGAISRPLSSVPLAEPGSRTAHEPSGAESSSRCRRLIPGSTGGPDRSISGSTPRTALRRPIRICLPLSWNRRSVLKAGNVTAGPVRPLLSSMRSKYGRSDVTTTDQVVGVNFGMGAVGGADEVVSAAGPSSEAGGRGGARVGSAGEAAYADQEYESAVRSGSSAAGGSGGAGSSGGPSSSCGAAASAGADESGGEGDPGELSQSSEAGGSSSTDGPGDRSQSCDAGASGAAGDASAAAEPSVAGGSGATGGSSQAASGSGATGSSSAAG